MVLWSMTAHHCDLAIAQVQPIGLQTLQQSTT